MLVLRAMTPEEQSLFQPLSLEHYAQEMASNYNAPIEEMRIEAQKEAEKAQMQNAQFLSIVANNQVLGGLMYLINESRQSAFLLEIFVYKEYRGKGWGKKALQTFEQQLKAAGIKQLRFNVFNDNWTAKNLYTSLNYEITNIMMQKEL